MGTLGPISPVCRLHIMNNAEEASSMSLEPVPIFLVYGWTMVQSHVSTARGNLYWKWNNKIIGTYLV